MPVVGSGSTTVTVRDLIHRAMRFIHVLGAGEAATTDESNDALVELNGLIEQANLEKLLSFYRTEISFPTVGGQQSYTIGPTATTPNVVAPRPVQILSAISRRSNVDLPIFVTQQLEDWQKLIQLKTIQIAGWIDVAYYEATPSKGTLLLYPIPLDSATTVLLNVNAQLSSYMSIDDVIDLPLGYQTWMAYTLGERLSVEYGREFTARMDKLLNQATAIVKANNIKPFPVATMEVSGLAARQGGSYNVYSDTVRGF